VHPHLLPARQLTVITYTDQTVGTVNNKKLSYLQGTAWSAVLVETVQNVAQMFVEWYLISPTTGEWHSSLEHSASRHLPVTSWQCKDPSQQFGVQSGSADVQRPQHPTRSYLHCLIQEWEHGYNLRSTTMMLCQPFTTTSAKNTFRCSSPAVWNSLPKTVLNSDSVAVFKSRRKTFLFAEAFSSSSAH